MQLIFYRTKAGKIILIFLLFVALTFIGGGFILNGLLRIPAPVANSIVVVAMLLVTRYFFKQEGKDLSALGLTLRRRQLRFIVPGILAGGFFVVILVYSYCFIKGYPVVFNPAANLAYIGNGLLLALPAVMLEELAFRGICFYKTAALTGTQKANIIFAVAFILSHWLNMESFDPLQMIVLLITGLGHVLYATAFLRSGTLYFPIALHLGNNWVNHFVFSPANDNKVSAGSDGSLIHIITGNPSAAADWKFITTTLTTAVLFMAFIWLMKQWNGEEKQASLPGRV